ncbi:hypothetical protein M0R45_009190 [Rubus argutus]|uniref:Uncharacterized protein n=1 Tax=Rubus argutus TaxID=59490 RepID=A0AAW1Y5A8_RUBAR
MMSENKIVVVSYDDAYKPKPCSNFTQAALRALFKCLGVEAPLNTLQVSDQSPEQVDDPPTTAVEQPELDAQLPQTSAGVIVSVARSALSTGSGAQIN